MVRLDQVLSLYILYDGKFGLDVDQIICQIIFFLLQFF